MCGIFDWYTALYIVILVFWWRPLVAGMLGVVQNTLECRGLQLDTVRTWLICGVLVMNSWAIRTQLEVSKEDVEGKSWSYPCKSNAYGRYKNLEPSFRSSMKPPVVPSSEHQSPYSRYPKEGATVQLEIREEHTYDEAQTYVGDLDTYMPIVTMIELGGSSI